MTEHEKAERRVVGRFAGNHMTTLRSALDPPALTCIHRAKGPELFSLRQNMVPGSVGAPLCAFALVNDSAPPAAKTQEPC